MARARVGFSVGGFASERRSNEIAEDRSLTAASAIRRTLRQGASMMAKTLAYLFIRRRLDSCDDPD